MLSSTSLTRLVFQPSIRLYLSSIRGHSSAPERQPAPAAVCSSSLKARDRGDVRSLNLGNRQDREGTFAVSRYRSKASSDPRESAKLRHLVLARNKKALGRDGTSSSLRRRRESSYIRGLKRSLKAPFRPLGPSGGVLVTSTSSEQRSAEDKIKFLHSARVGLLQVIRRVDSSKAERLPLHTRPGRSNTFLFPKRRLRLSRKLLKTAEKDSWKSRRQPRLSYIDKQPESTLSISRGIPSRRDHLSKLQELATPGIAYQKSKADIWRKRLSAERSLSCRDRTASFRKLRDRAAASRATEATRIGYLGTCFGTQVFGFLRLYESAVRKDKHYTRAPKQSFHYTKMKSWIQFLTTPTADTPGTTLLLHFDNRRYLFGHCSEGTQRACVQRKMGLMRLEHVFLTGKIDWATTGGLLGMILTLADGKASSAEHATKRISTDLKIHGSHNLTHMLATARRFVFRQGLPLQVNEIAESVPSEQVAPIPPTFEDDNVRIWAMATTPITESSVLSSSSLSPRKRSHVEMQDNRDQVIDGEETHEERMDRYMQIRQGVVGHMFDSDWRMDSLITMKLSEVKLPANIFWRINGKLQKYDGPLPESKEPLEKDPEVLVRRPWPGALVDSLPPTIHSNTSTSYIIKNHPQRGKFNPAAAKKHNVMPGKKFQLLTMGESVLSEDGKRVTPEMVLAPGKDGAGVAVLDIPDRTFIDAIISRPELSSQDVMKGIGAIVWILGNGVYGDERLTDFMGKTKLQHILSSPDVCPNEIALESPATAAIRLNGLDSERFPIPVHTDKAMVEVLKQENVAVARAGTKIDLEPVFKIINELATNRVDAAAATPSDEVLKLGEEARLRTIAPDYIKRLADLQSDLLCKDADVTTLGTGSAMPSKYRNVSATLLRIPEYGNYLFDAGENTLGQLKRVFGPELPEVLRNLKVIWISHLHADHHLGTASVIKAWHEATKDDPSTSDNKLMVATAKGMLRWLQEWSSVEDYGYSRIMPVDMTNSKGTLVKHMTEFQISAFNLMSIKSIPVVHCHEALAVVLEMPNGFKVAYSGDCRPCPEFATAGKGATLLIHEATFDDAMQGDAYAKKHSTTAEALDIGRQMEARRIVLTHFSQRYQKIPVMENTEGKDQIAIVAFDYMKCKIGDFAKLAEYRPALLELYDGEE